MGVKFIKIQQLNFKFPQLIEILSFLLVALVIAMPVSCSPIHARHLHSRPDREVLPNNVQPTHYDLTITPNMEAFTFEGRVLIR